MLFDPVGSLRRPSHFTNIVNSDQRLTLSPATRCLSPSILLYSSLPLCVSLSLSSSLSNVLSFRAEIDIERCVQDSIKIFCSTPKSATYRQHALTTPKTSTKQQTMKPVLSYYSQDYHETPKTQLVLIIIIYLSGFISTLNIPFHCGLESIGGNSLHVLPFRCSTKTRIQ